jgi:DNA-binding MarR family transcriptional regulator
VQAGSDEELGELGRQFGLFLRRADRFRARLRPDDHGEHLDRAAYLLLSRLAAHGPARLSALAGDACLDLSTVSRQVAALEADGLVERAVDPADRRASVIAASARGMDMYDRHRRAWMAALSELTGDWTSAERREFTRLLGRVNESIGNRPPGGGRDRGTHDDC